MRSAQCASPDGRSRPSVFRRLGVPTAALSLALGAAQVVAAAPSQAAASTARVAVGRAPVLPKNTKAAAAPSSSTKLTLDVELATGKEAALQAYATDVENRSSVYYHQYLTPAQVRQDFGASQTETDAVLAQLKTQGLSDAQITSDGMFVHVTTTVGQAEHAFGVNITGYQAAGRHFYANTTAPTVASSISGYVRGIVGLDDVGYAVPEYASSGRMVKAPASSAKHAAVTSQAAVNGCANAENIYGQAGYVDARDYYTADAVSKAYGMNGVPSNGSGVTVAVFELENFDPTGVQTLQACYGTNVSVTEEKVDGGPTAPADMSNNVGVESALDIEDIASLAPGVSIIDYAGPDATSDGDTQVLDTYSAIVNEDKAQVVSISWGSCELMTDSPFMTSSNTLFQQAATEGQTVLAASGDQGSAACYGATTDSTTASAVSADDPASQPFVTGVGGTWMNGTSDIQQTVWNRTVVYQGETYPGGGGGGLSTQWPLQPYQTGDLAPGYAAHCAAANGCREEPDVSALADPAAGYLIEEYASNGGTDSGEYYNIIGGTSGAAPTWAAIIALADSSSQCAANGKAGFLNPALYAAGNSMAGYSVFRDITSGNNDVSGENAAYGFNSANGYDMASGWGTPNAPGVVAAVCKGALVSPASYYVPMTPTRILDTRTGLGASGPVAPLNTAKVQIGGAHGVPAGVSAVVLNVTVADAKSNGVATVYPDGSSLPSSSNLNWAAGEIVPNLVVVPVGSDGYIDIWNGSPNGSTDFIGDLQGYFTTSSTGASTYTAVGPVRAMDTRDGTGSVAKAKIATGGYDSLQVEGATFGAAGHQITIPATGVTAVAMNVTVADSTSNGFVTVYPDLTTPTSSNVNYAKGEIVPNMTIVQVGTNGKVDFANSGPSGGATDVIADISGYFTAGTSGQVYHPLGPDRVLDTRIALGNAGATPIAGLTSLTLPLPTVASAIVANVTVTGPQSNGFITAYPAGGAIPSSSNLNFATGETVPNLAIIPSKSGVSFYNAGSRSTNLIADIAGYFSAS